MTVVSTYSTDNIFIQELQSWKIKGLVWPKTHLAVRVPRLPYCHCDSLDWSLSKAPLDKLLVSQHLAQVEKCREMAEKCLFHKS